MRDMLEKRYILAEWEACRKQLLAVATRARAFLPGLIHFLPGYPEYLRCTASHRYVFKLPYDTVKLRHGNNSLICSNFQQLVMCDCDLACMPEMNLMARDIFMMSSLLFPPGRKRFSWRRRLFSGEIDCWSSFDLKMWSTRRKSHPHPPRPIEYQRWQVSLWWTFSRTLGESA